MKIVDSRRLLQENKPGDPIFLLLGCFPLIDRRHQVKFEKFLRKEFFIIDKLPFLTFIENPLRRNFFK